LIKIIILEENFKWHLKAFASELFVYCTYQHVLNKHVPVFPIFKNTCLHAFRFTYLASFTVFLDCLHIFSERMPHILRTLHTNLKTLTQLAKLLNSPAKWNFTLKTMLFLLKMVFCFQMTHTNHHMN